MIKFKANTPMSRDCTCGYDVKLDKEYTLEEFLNAIWEERRGDWGEIVVKHSMFDDTTFRYSNDRHSIPACLNKYEKVKEVRANGGWSHMDYIIVVENKVENVPENTKGYLRFIVKKPNGEESVVVIFKNKSDGTYSFVNLTKEHICSCKFKTIEEAIQDMNDRLRKGLIESYVVKGEMKP